MLGRGIQKQWSCGSADDVVAAPAFVAVAHGPSESCPERFGFGGGADIDFPIAVFRDKLVDDCCAQVGSAAAEVFPDLEVPDHHR